MPGELQKDRQPNRILDFCATAFNEKSFGKVSMEEISRELKISKKTIYKYFKSKEDILQAMITTQLEKLENKLKKSIRNEGQIELFAIMADSFIDFLSRISPALQREISEDFPHFTEQINLGEKNVYHKNLVWIAKELRSKGTISYAIPTRELSLGFFEMVRGLKDLPEENRNYMISVFVKGLRNTEERKKKKKK